MPFTKPDMRREALLWVGWVLLLLDRRLTEWSDRITLPVLIAALVTGEILPWMDASGQWVSVPMVRSIHVVAGLLVLVLALGKLGGMLLRAGMHIFRHKSLHPGFALALFRAKPPARRFLDTAIVILLVLVLVSGLARLALWGIPPFQPGVSAPFGIPIVKWMVLHRTILPYFYTLLLFLFVIRGRMFFKRTLAYLQAP